MKTISLKVPDGLHNQLVWLAKVRKQTKSEVVRDALELMVKKGGDSGASGSFLDAARKWIGCVEGSGDLSTNPKYMDGFGE